MAPAGYEMIQIAKTNGKWNALDDLENLVLPADLEAALQAEPQANSYWEKPDTE